MKKLHNTIAKFNYAIFKLYYAILRFDYAIFLSHYATDKLLLVFATEHAEVHVALWVQLQVGYESVGALYGVVQVVV